MTTFPYLMFAGGLMIGGVLQERTPRITHSGEAKARYEATCVRNIPAVRSAQTDAAGRFALQSMASCPDTGTALVAERWRGRPTDTAYIAMLQQVSRNINDERIADAVMDLVEDPAAPEAMRRRALESITTQLSPTIYVTLGTLISVPSRPGQVVRGSGVGGPHFYLAGRREIGPESRARYEQRLLALADRDSALAGSIRYILKVAEDARRLR